MSLGTIYLVTGVPIGVAMLGIAGYLLVQAWVRRLLAVAYTDPLTGLPGRALAERLLDEAARTGRPVTVALADADQLSTVNTVSHADGDRYLIAIAQRLRNALAGQGTVARFGGDEFMLITTLSPAEFCSRLESTPPVPVPIGGATIHPRVSTGVCAADGGDPRQALARADQAGHTAKRLGGDRVLIYDSVRDAPVQGCEARQPRLGEAIGRGGLLRLHLTLAEARTLQDVLIDASGGRETTALAARVRDLIAMAESDRHPTKVNSTT